MIRTFHVWGRSIFLLVTFILFFSSCMTVAAATGHVYGIYRKTVPSFPKLNQWNVAEATRIYDASDNLLYEIYANERRYVVPSNKIASEVKLATLAIEDERFYRHHGIDIRGFSRALFRNIVSRRWEEGGSTITQQLVKNIYLSPDRTVDRKIQEIVLAHEMEKRYTKDEILTMYLNTVGYGSNAYGVESASTMYFHKSASDLTMPEAAFLAAMTKAPSDLSPYGVNRSKLEWRKNHVLHKMAGHGTISPGQMIVLRERPVAIYPRSEIIRAPHFVMFIRQQLIERYGQDVVERGGLSVKTTLQADRQQLAETTVAEATTILEKAAAQNAALIAIDPQTGAIQAMVGSRNYFDTKNDGNVNVTIRLRQPGSTFKPVVYATAFAQGPWAPGSTIYDVPTDFGSENQPYTPQNYDGKTHGAISLREALANSYNIPAVKMLALVGKDKAIATARELGITTFDNPDRLGLSLVIGGGDVRLLELAGAYGSFANQGVFMPPYGVEEISRHGRVLYHTEPSGKVIFPAQVAYQINSILSDQAARAPIFGQGGPLHVEGHTTAVKTGTTNDYRDAWTIGYTPSLVTGIWVGNNDFSPMNPGSAGAMAAAPIWNSFMAKALVNQSNQPFSVPLGIETMTVDSLTGKIPSGITVATRQDIFAEWQRPGENPAPSYQIGQCQNNSAFQAFSLVQSEQPNNPKWELPVFNWARDHGLARGNLPTSTEDCHGPVVQLASVPGILPKRP